MALTIGSQIVTNDALNEFTNTVINTILQDAVDATNIPKYGTYNCISPEIVGIKSLLPKASITKGTSITASVLYSHLHALTTTLTRVGTYSYTHLFQVQTTWTTQYTKSGKALFTEDYVKTLLVNATTNNIQAGSFVSVSEINNLFANLLSAWRNTAKYHSLVTTKSCHSDCYGNCHYVCHSDCHNDDCYK